MLRKLSSFAATMGNQLHTLTFSVKYSTIYVKITHLVRSKSANKLSTSCVRTACPKLSTSLEQAVNNLNNLVEIIVARLFQQVRYSHDITILLQPCVVNLLTVLLYHQDMLEQPCNKSDDAIKLVTSC